MRRHTPGLGHVDGELDALLVRQPRLALVDQVHQVLAVGREVLCRHQCRPPVAVARLAAEDVIVASRIEPLVHDLDPRRVGPLLHQVVGQGQQLLAVAMAGEVAPLHLGQAPGAVGGAECLHVLAELLQVAVALQDVGQCAFQGLLLLRFGPRIGQVAGQRQRFVAEDLGDLRADEQQLRILLLLQQHDEPRLGRHRLAGFDGRRQRYPQRLRAGRADGQVLGEDLVDRLVVLLRQLRLGVIERRGVGKGRRKHRRQGKKPGCPRQVVHRWLAFCRAICRDLLRTHFARVRAAAGARIVGGQLGIDPPESCLSAVRAIAVEIPACKTRPLLYLRSLRACKNPLPGFSLSSA